LIFTGRNPIFPLFREAAGLPRKGTVVPFLSSVPPFPPFFLAMHSPFKLCPTPVLARIVLFPFSIQAEVLGQFYFPADPSPRVLVTS